MKKVRKIINVYGIVQGVGFRPFVYNLANMLDIKGYVINTSSGVYIDVEGCDENIGVFIKTIKLNPPELAQIQKIDVFDKSEYGYKEFEIRKSKEDGGFIPVSPDMGICDQCLKELFDPNDRRYRYPFINCTNCGPRYTIIKDIPYDRPLTTMNSFKMCSKCQNEYDNPSNRRFHAQPNACSVCGPKVYWLENSKISGARKERILIGEDSIKQAVEYLRQGKVVAIKGIGGFHLAVDAGNEKAVRLLRERKRRYAKPLAVMVSTLEQVKGFAEISNKEERLLFSQRRPIVLLNKSKGFDSIIAPSVAPNTNTIGVMMAYAPIQYIILNDFKLPLVMTSGNISDEPIAKDNDDAIKSLGEIADGFLLNDRDIFARIDDSVAMVMDREVILIRRARGYAPQPIFYNNTANRDILAVGPHDKVTFCLVRDNNYFLSQHIGDMDNPKAFVYFRDTVERYKRLFRVDPQIVAYDMHPDYITTQYALSLKGIKKVAIQHHHAHIASCMADNGLTNKVIGVAYDGTGYGDDGNIWGGEILLADLCGYKRLCHLRYIPMVGGLSAIKKIYKMGLSYMFASGREFAKFIKDIDIDEYKVLRNMAMKKVNSPLVSSIGRLFDAVAAVTGLIREVRFEGEAAIILESLAKEWLTDDYYEYELKQDGDMLIIDPVKTVVMAYEDVIKGVGMEVISTKFHNTIAKFTIDAIKNAYNLTGIKNIVLTGGVFQNRYLLKKIKNFFERESFKIFFNHNVPPNDGGISLGQAVIASNLIQDE